MKRTICFSIVVLLLFSFTVNVMAEQAGYTPPSSGEDGSLYFDIVTNGQWENQGTPGFDQQENMRAIFIGNNYGSTYSENWYTAWEGSYGWENKATATGSTAKFYTLDFDQALSIVDTDSLKLRLTLGAHDRYYDADQHDNYFGFLGGSEAIVNCLSGLFFLEGSAEYSLYALDKAGGKMDILNCKAKLVTEAGLTIGYRYSFYKNDAGVKHSNSGMTVGFTF
jgi:hypothetical protein